MINNIPLIQIQFLDLHRLVENGVIEHKRLDYKEDLPKFDGQGTSHFLMDVASMANTLGGDIVFGIREQRDGTGKSTGIPEEVTGIDVPNWDQLRLQLDQKIRDGIAPRIQGIQIEKVALESGKVAVIIRIPSSLQAPHMITFQRSSPFYIRTSGGNVPMDVGEIRQAFLRTGNAFERADNFRRNRVGHVTAGQAPINLYSGARVFLHVIPLGTDEYMLDFSRAEIYHSTQQLLSLHKSSSHESRLNLDGRLNFTRPWGDGLSRSYVQIFRNASVEFCDTYLIGPPDMSESKHSRIQTPYFEEEVVRGLRDVLELYQQLVIPFPITVFLTLVAVRGFVMYSPDEYRRFTMANYGSPIDRDDLFLPGQLIDQPSVATEVTLKPIFDTIWNAAGLPRSLVYQEDGTWTPGK